MELLIKEAIGGKCRLYLPGAKNVIEKPNLASALAFIRGYLSGRQSDEGKIVINVDCLGNPSDKFEALPPDKRQDYEEGLKLGVDVLLERSGINGKEPKA